MIQTGGLMSRSIYSQKGNRIDNLWWKKEELANLVNRAEKIDFSSAKHYHSQGFDKYNLIQLPVTRMMYFTVFGGQTDNIPGAFYWVLNKIDNKFVANSRTVCVYGSEEDISIDNELKIDEDIEHVFDDWDKYPQEGNQSFNWNHDSFWVQYTDDIYLLFVTVTAPFIGFFNHDTSISYIPSRVFLYFYNPSKFYAR
jgi:hypothetical protein